MAAKDFKLVCLTNKYELKNKEKYKNNDLLSSEIIARMMTIIKFLSPERVKGSSVATLSQIGPRKPDRHRHSALRVSGLRTQVPPLRHKLDQKQSL